MLLNFDFYQQDQWIVFQISATSNCGTSTYDVAFYSPVSGGAYMIYPNPADTELTVAYTDVVKGTQETTGQLNSSREEPEAFEVLLTDFNGNILISAKNEIGNKQLKLNTRRIPVGIYFVQITDENTTIVKKVIISR